MKRTTLNPGTKPLQRKTALQSTSTLRRSSPPKPTSHPPQPGEEAAKATVRKRSGGVCEIQLPGKCLGRAKDFHHRQNRGRDKVGKWVASNGLDVCRVCHDAVTNTNGRRAEYVQKGWIVPRRKDPALAPVLVWPMGVVLLRDDGSWTQKHPDDLPVLLTDNDDSLQEGAA